MPGLASRIALAAACAAGLSAAPAHALGPVDVELGAFYSAGDAETDGGIVAPASDTDSAGYRAELWLSRWGARLQHVGVDFDALDRDDATTSIDLLYRVVAPAGGSYLALGAGWHEASLLGAGYAETTEGAALAADARVGLGLLALYAQGAYYPSLDDVQLPGALAGGLEDLSGHELELGLAWRVAPFFALRAGYRLEQTEFRAVPVAGTPADGETRVEGPLAGLSFRF